MIARCALVPGDVVTAGPNDYLASPENIFLLFPSSMFPSK